MIRWHNVAAIVLSMALGGCASMDPAPVDDRARMPAQAPLATVPPPSEGEGVAASEDGQVVMIPLPAPQASPRATPPQPQAGSSARTETPRRSNPAVAMLLNQANEQRQAGQPEQAAASLERALKIEPSNAWLWHRLAQVRLEQGRYSEVAALAARSNSFARGDRVLMANNWLLIAQAERGLGRRDAAKAAEQRARALNPQTS